MFRAAHVLLTVVGMLVCPTLCVQIGAVKAAAHEVPACCDEHEGQPEEGAGGSEAPSGCKAHGCICCGAVQPRTVLFDDAVVDAVVDLGAPVPQAPQFVREELAARLDRGPPHPTLAGGRDARIFFASLTI